MGKQSFVAKVAAIAFCAVMVASLAACTGTSSSSGGSSASSAASASSESSSLASALSASSSASGSSSTKAEYASKLFDSSYVHTIDIAISDEDWADLLVNPTDKTKYKVDVTIDGEKVEQVSFATKGNTSLTSVASDADSDRYSFKLNFGKYVDNQTYYGLDKLNLNNLYADATYMKDYLSYKLFSEVGVESPLTSYVWITVNGEDLGLYLAIEEIDSSYLDRTVEGEGELYKPETEMLGNMDEVGKGGPGGQMPEGMQFPNGDYSGRSAPSLGGGMQPPSGSAQAPDGSNQASSGSSSAANGDNRASSGSAESASGSAQGPGGQGQFPGGQMPEGMQLPGGGFGFGGGANGADLTYTDDELSSYSDIFDNAETKVTEEDEQRVVAALKALSEGNVEQALDTSEVIKYFAAHNFVLNYDSYTGTMLHNYYLYENDGKLSMLPWDYNLAFGGFGGDGGGFGGGFGGRGDASQQSQGSASAQAPQADASTNNATSLVNVGIDSPLSGANESSRPMWAWIAENDQYTSQYHEALNSLVSGYFESGDFEKEIDALYEMLLPYVQKDPSAFYTADEFTEAYKTLKEFCLLRAQSVRAQLEGSLATTTSGQNAADQVDASAISVDAMGKQGGQGGPGMGNREGRPSDQ